MEIKYVDNHAHLNFAAFDNDREETILRAREAGVVVCLQRYGSRLQ